MDWDGDFDQTLEAKEERIRKMRSSFQISVETEREFGSLAKFIKASNKLDLTTISERLQERLPRYLQSIGGSYKGLDDDDDVPFASFQFILIRIIELKLNHRYLEVCWRASAIWCMRDVVNLVLGGFYPFKMKTVYDPTIASVRDIVQSDWTSNPVFIEGSVVLPGPLFEGTLSDPIMLQPNTWTGRKCFIKISMQEANEQQPYVAESFLTYVRNTGITEERKNAFQDLALLEGMKSWMQFQIYLFDLNETPLEEFFEWVLFGNGSTNNISPLPALSELRTQKKVTRPNPRAAYGTLAPNRLRQEDTLNPLARLPPVLPPIKTLRGGRLRKHRSMTSINKKARLKKRWTKRSQSSKHKPTKSRRKKSKL